MKKMRRTSIIYRFMIEELDLRGDELIVYSVIFDATKKYNKYDDTLANLAEFTNISKRSLKSILQNLLDKNLIKVVSESELFERTAYITTNFDKRILLNNFVQKIEDCISKEQFKATEVATILDNDFEYFEYLLENFKSSNRKDFRN